MINGNLQAHIRQPSYLLIVCEENQELCNAVPIKSGKPQKHEMCEKSKFFMCNSHLNMKNISWKTRRY